MQEPKSQPKSFSKILSFEENQGHLFEAKIERITES